MTPNAVKADMIRLMPLPVEPILPELCRALHQGHAVLTSPPGSGKTTRVPLALLDQPWLRGQKILMLEPRRPAARMAATYMARLRGEDLGQTIGYQVRMERRIGPHTRIEVLTEGLLVRRLQSDPELEGVGLIIFDEFHERSLQADLGLALSLDVCAALREDLRLLVMSATLEASRVAQLLGGRHITSDGGLHPVEIRHLPSSAGSETLAACARLALTACREQNGDVLVFLPGKAEIEQLRKQLQTTAPALEILSLHGEMDATTQSRALNPPQNPGQRLILATDVAETSLTIEGIGAVVDSGLSRKPGFDANSGLTRLQLLPIAQASAQQRAGRAGRLGPGICYRAYTEQEYRQRPAQRPAEMLQTDLAPLVLELALWGVTDAASLHWLDTPPKAAWNQGKALLQQLDALDSEGQLTKHGRKLAGFGIHPRLAHLLACAGADNAEAADLAALLSERDPWRPRPGQPRPADLSLRLAEMQALREGRKPSNRIHQGALRQLLRLSARLQQQAARLGRKQNPPSAAQLLALAYPDRVAQRRSGSDGRYLLRSGKGAVLARDDGLAVADFLAVAHMDAGIREGRIWLALPLQKHALQQIHAPHLQQQDELYWDAAGQRVRAKNLTRLGALVIRSQDTRPADPRQVQALLLAQIKSAGIAVLPWNNESRQLQARITLARLARPQSTWPDIGDSALQHSLHHWLTPWIEGMRGFADLQQLDMQQILLAMLDWEQQQQLDRWLPRRWRLADGSSAAIDYCANPPVLAVPLQLMFGVQQTPAVLQRQLPLKLQLLSPAGHPLQVTTDLQHFWDHAWHEVKKEMRGRYPKHQWPDDPLQARPVRLKRNL